MEDYPSTVLLRLDLMDEMGLMLRNCAPVYQARYRFEAWINRLINL